jgi:uncharacterized protein YhdP
VTIPADGGSPHLELEGVARDVRLAAAPSYLPVGVMPDKVVAWLDDALRAGRVDAAPFRFNGPTRSSRSGKTTGFSRSSSILPTAS